MVEKKPKKSVIKKTSRKRSVRNQDPSVVNTQEAEKLLKLTRVRISQLVKDGYIEKLGRDKYHIISLVHGYIDFLKDEDRRGQKGQAQTRVADARAKQIDLKNAKEERKLMDVNEAVALFEEITGTFVAALNGLPAQLTRDIAERERIEKVIDRQRTVLETRFSKSAKDILPDSEVANADEKKPTRRVGKRK